MGAWRGAALGRSGGGGCRSAENDAPKVAQEGESMSIALYILLACVAYVGVVLIIARCINSDYPMDWED